MAWPCPRCDGINCDSFTFRSYDLDNTNFFAPLQSLSSIDSFHSSVNFSPHRASSPRLADHTPKSPSPQSPTNKIDQSSTSSVFELPKKRNLRILNVNCQSISLKTQELAAVLEYTKPDVVCGTESWLHGIQPGKNPTPNHIKSSEIFPSNYNVFRNDRGGRTGGGVFILVQKSLIATEQTELITDCELEWVKIKLQNRRDLYVGCFYMPKRDQRDLNELQKSLEKLSDNQKHQRDIILAGDFNCPDINWSQHTSLSSGNDKTIQQSLVDFTSSSLLSQIHHTPTRGQNILDLVFTSNPSLAKSSVSIPGISDHLIVVSDFDTRPHVTRAKPRKCFKYAKANWEALKSDLDSAAKEIEDGSKLNLDIDSLWNKFKSSLLTSLEKNVPSFMLKPKSRLPWLSANIRKLLKKKQKLFKRAKNSNNWSPYRQFQKHCRRELRRAEWRYINGIIQDGLKKNDTKPFWRFIKSKKQDNVGIAPLKQNGTLHIEGEAKANILLEQFKSVFTKSCNTPLPTLPPTRPPIQPLVISTAGVYKLLKDIKPNKASGPDEIPNIILKTLAENIAPSLAIIFQSSIDTGRLPKDWLAANVSCAFKKGDRHLASNYRPISLTSVSCKLLEHIIFRHIMNHMEEHSILTNLNHGFRSGFSTETQLITTTQDLLSSFDSGKQIDMAILDFSKAFDTVPHDRLLYKMENFGICDSLLKWLRCFLTERNMRVVVDGANSPSTSVDSGVPQGTVLGPLLFLCHINDLPEAVKSQVRLFADDCLLYREIVDFQDHYTLQRDLKSLEEWAAKWGMRFNASKCYIMSLARNPPSSFMYSLDNTFLQTVSSNPYLGVLFSNNLTWTEHINKITKKANCSLGFLKRNLRHCPTSCKKSAYLALVRPLLEYGAIIWDPYQKQDVDKMESTQRHAARFISGDFRSRTPGFVTGLLRKYDLPPLQERRENLRLTFLYKVVEGLVPAIPSDKFLTPQKPGRKIRPRNISNTVSQNPIDNYIRNNNRCFNIPAYNTKQYQNSFFPRTIIAWNKLDDVTVQAKSVESFKSALTASKRR